MENATKALMMASAILISIMILSLGVYLYSVMSNYTSSAKQQIVDNQVLEFNNKFLEYSEKEEVTIQDIVTVANCARQSNEDYGLSSQTKESDNTYYVAVYFGKDQIEKANIGGKSADDYFNDLLKTSDPSIKYKCEVTINQNTARINRVNFTQK